MNTDPRKYHVQFAEPLSGKFVDNDFKGHDFRKAGASEEIEAYFKGIISDCILGENLDLVRKRTTGRFHSYWM